MERFTSEVLPSGLKVEGNGNNFTLSFGETKLFLSRLDIARMYGIANPEKRHGSCTNIIRCMADSCEQEAVCVMEDGTHLCSDCQLSFVENQKKR